MELERYFERALHQRPLQCAVTTEARLIGDAVARRLDHEERAVLRERTMREAIEFHLEGLRASGEPVPEPGADAGRLAVA